MRDLICEDTMTDPSTSDLVTQLISSWGSWPIFVGIAVALFVRAAQVLRPAYWEQVPSRYRPLIGVVLAGLPAAALALTTGGTWADAAVALAGAWVAAAGSADAMRLAFGKPTTRAQ
ncbi:MAG: hypothetical protein WDA41_11095 [Candidatus Neomarinimicrobiota bacterium]